MSFGTSSLRGQLGGPTSSISVPADVSATVQFYRADSDGNFDSQAVASPTSYVLSNGSYTTKLYRLNPGKYFPFFRIAGSHTLPSFIGEPLFINAAGQYSDAESTGFAAPAAFTLSSPVPGADQINLKVSMVSPAGTGVSESAFIDLTKNDFDAGIFNYWGAGFSLTGKASYALPNGTFSLLLRPQNPAYIARDLLIVVEGGAVKVSEGQVNPVELTPEGDGVYSLAPLAPNALFSIEAGGGNAPFVAVSIERGGAPIAMGLTDANGVVRLNIPNIESPFTVRIQPDSNPVLALLYSTTSKSFDGVTLTDGLFKDSIALEKPNFVASISGIGQNSGVVKNAWVDFYDEKNEVWGYGSNSGTNGRVALNLPLPTAGEITYRVNVNPSWSNPELLGPRSYFVTVDANGVKEVLTDTIDGILVPAVGDIYSLTLASPSVRGTVTLPDGVGVRDSYVNVSKTLQGFDQYLQGGSSRSNGKFGLVVPNGTFELYANSPWNLSGYAKSARCQVTVFDGILDVLNSGACASSGEVRLALRSPNLKFKLLDNSGPVPNANVNISIGNWHTWAQSGQDGSVSLFIDNDEIAAKNSSMPASNVNISVDPPYGNSDIVRWNCSVGEAKPLCSELASYFSGSIFNPRVTQLTLPDVTFANPNTRLKVSYPDPQADPAHAFPQGAWVSLFYEEDGWRRWIGGANTNSQGEAAFNVDAYPEGAKFAVEVNAPWGKRQTYSQTLYKGLSLAQVNGGNFNLGTPNLNLTVNQAGANGTSKWSWVQVEEVEEVEDTYFNHVAWLDGYGTDESGRVALTLPTNKTVKLTLHPGPGSIGARISCVFSVDADSKVSVDVSRCPANQEPDLTNGAITLALSAGNVTGKVTGENNPVGLAGAVVFAQAYVVDTDTLANVATEQTVTAEDGSYGLQLDTLYDWRLQVFYVKPEGQVNDYESSVTPLSLSAATLGTDKIIDFTLIPKVTP